MEAEVWIPIDGACPTCKSCELVQLDNDGDTIEFKCDACGYEWAEEHAQ